MKCTQLRRRRTTTCPSASTPSPYTNMYRYSPMASRLVLCHLELVSWTRDFFQLTLGSSLGWQVWWSPSFPHAKIYLYFPYCCLELAECFFFPNLSRFSVKYFLFIILFGDFFLSPSPLPGDNSTCKLLFQPQLMLQNTSYLVKHSAIKIKCSLMFTHATSCQEQQTNREIFWQSFL